jgi:hypothetical protein
MGCSSNHWAVWDNGWRAELLRRSRGQGSRSSPLHLFTLAAFLPKVQTAPVIMREIDANVNIL